MRPLADKGTGPPAPHQPGTAAATANLRTTARIAEDDRPVTSAQSLLYAAASDVTIERVRALVRQVGAESPTIEYKEQMCDTIARGVAALGNTYGGLLLVGVTDDRIVRGVKEKTIESAADHCAAKIEPPWVPEIIAVPLGQGSDLYVLVLRVVPGHHPRPPQAPAGQRGRVHTAPEHHSSRGLAAPA